ncbi:MAG TPA: glycerol-3-phosphate dehydrogenase C-terminal domain-containing protein, partial [Acidimicrobiales bacterium]
QVLPRAAVAPEPAAPLPGAAAPTPVSRVLQGQLPARVADHLARHYGTLSHEVVALAVSDPALLQPIHPDGPDIWAQVAYAAGHEWACTVDDVLRRRTTVTVRGLDTPDVRRRATEMLRPRRVSARPSITWSPRRRAARH